MNFSHDSSREEIRLETLQSYSILDTLPDSDYDGLTAIASEICNTPISLITLIDDRRQWFKSHHGLAIRETPKEYSFCAFAIQKPSEVFVIPDARKDKRFLANPLVTGEPYVVFYAGVPLVADNGTPLGTLCIIDRKPRRLTESQKQSLEALSNQVMKLLELRKNKHELQKANRRLEEKNAVLEKFAVVAATGIKSPLRKITNSYSKLHKKYRKKIGKGDLKLLSSVRNSATRLSNMLDGLLRNAKADYIQRQHKEKVSSADIQLEIEELYPQSDDYQIEFFFTSQVFIINKIALLQVLINLVSNAIRYNDKVVAQVEIGAREDDRFYEFFVSDNGPGIDEKQYASIYEPFTVLNQVDRYGEYGVGIGLANVKKMLEETGGDITVDSDKGEGTIFTFSLPK